MAQQKRFFRRPLPSVKYFELKKQEEPSCDLVLEIMNEKEFGTNQKKLPKEIIKVLEGFKGYHKKGGHFLPLSTYNKVIQDLHKYEFTVKDIPLEVIKHFKKEIEGKQEEEETKKINLSSMPPIIMEKLKPFQREGIEFGIRHDGKCLIADEMGLGKTLQALAIASYYKKDWPLLII